MAENTSSVRDVQVRDRHEALQTYLEQNINGFKGPLSVAQFSSGQSNPTFLLSTSAKRYVLRKKPSGKLLPSAHAMDREYTILSKLHIVGFPVPTPIIYCADTTVLGVEFYIMEYVEGRIFRDPSLPSLSPQQRELVYNETVETLARLHQLDWKKVGLGGYGKDGASYYERQIAVWSRGYKASKTHPIPEMDNLIEWLPKNIPPFDGRTTIVHGDFRIDNVIFHPTSFKVIAVLDWELSTIGHPVADFAYFAIPHLFASKDKASMTSGVKGMENTGIPSLQHITSTYCKHTNRQKN